MRTDIIARLEREIEELKRRVANLEKKVSPFVDRYGVHDAARVGALRDRIKVDND